ncbi:dihydrodipicolinate synthase family protein [Oceanobacillus sp. CF4.6]|uniref:dihydrodipicolinate synthase family protein n=1 Tax=Oceanobacillus sp. CF4.6 TaxID=3373080 RepID=UPI003EE70831
MIKTNFHGIIPPVSIILDTDGNLDEKGMATVIDFLIDAKVDGLFSLGSGGEFSQMSVELRKEIAEFTTNYVAGRVPVLIGTGSSSTKEAVSLSQHAEKVGADGVVVINPYYWTLTEENLFAHYAEIAESIELPILLYNFPTLTGQDLSPEFVLKLVDKYENIIGIKETIDSIAHIESMISTVKSKYPDFTVFAGFDNHLFNTLTLGGDGAICASVNFAPEIAVELYKAFRENDLEQAVKLHRKIAGLPKVYNLDSPFIGVIKEAMKLRGLDISTYVLPPTRELSTEKKEQLIEILKTADLL